MHLIPLLALLGALSGLAGHTLLTRLRRGAVVHKGWCTLGVALLWMLAAWRAATNAIPHWWLPIPLVVAWFAVLLTVTDLKHRRLPNALTLTAYPVIAVVMTAATTHGGGQLAIGALIGGGVLALTYAAMHVLSPRSMGAGDVKLSGSQGAVLGALGWPSVLIGTLVAALCTLLLNVLTPGRIRERWRSGIPHGPALLGATYVLATFGATSWQ